MEMYDISSVRKFLHKRKCERCGPLRHSKGAIGCYYDEDQIGPGEFLCEYHMKRLFSFNKNETEMKCLFYLEDIIKFCKNRVDPLLCRVVRGQNKLNKSEGIENE